MSSPALIVMAAGAGSRYGGLKQLDPVGPHGEFLMDYSAYDAAKAGFARLVFVIRKDIEDLFREKIGRRIERRIDTAYVFQSIEDLPAGLERPIGREKPWGTGHAVYCCRSVVKSPFAVINADDYYGPSTFRVLRDFLDPAEHRGAGHGSEDGQGETRHYCMVGFQLEKTLTENGPVSRGICSIDTEGCLREIHERTRIQGFGDGVRYTEDGTTWVPIPANSTASMNAWGLTPDFFQDLEAGFPRFFRENRENILRAEYLLPAIVGDLVSARKARVTVLHSGEKWYGMTYREDAPIVRSAIADMVRRGTYPEALWGA